MTARYFGFNTLAGALRTSAAVADGLTTVGRFDSAYVSSAISIPSNGTNDYLSIAAPFADGSTSITGTVWLRLDYYTPNHNSSGLEFLKCMNTTNNAYRIVTVSNTLQVQYWNSGTTAWVNWGAAYASPLAGLGTYAFKLTPNVGYELYVGGLLVASSAVVPTNGASAITEFRLGPTNGTNACNVSQIMGADYDIRDAHLFSRLANANGTYATDGTGTYTDVNETVLDDGTAIQLPTVGQHRTFTKTSITVPVGLSIAGMLVNARGRIGGSVADGKILCKQGANDTLSSGKSYGAAYAPRSHFFATDPSTSSAWDQTGYNSAEFGFAAA